MAKSQLKSILDLPDEVIESYILPHLEYDDLLILIKVQNRRLKNCTLRFIRKIASVSTLMINLYGDYNVV